MIGFGMTTMILRGIIFPQTVFFSSVAAYIMGTGCSTSLTAALGANYANFTDKTQREISRFNHGIFWFIERRF